MVTTYGIISDIHSKDNPETLFNALSLLMTEGADRFILNGDLIADKTKSAGKEYLALLLEMVGKIGKETYVVPGSHETVADVYPVVNHFKRRHSNIISTLDTSVVNNQDHQLVFLPGSDTLCGGEFQLGDHQNIPSGLYLRTERGITPYNPNLHQKLARERQLQGLLQYTNIHDLKNLIAEPETAIVVCHVPRKFDSLETAVDFAEFAEVEKLFHADIVEYQDGEKQVFVYSQEGRPGTIFKPKPTKSITRNEIFREGAIFPLETAIVFEKAGAPLKVKRKNSGNDSLKTIYESLGITKAINGHFHESAHHAHDRQCHPVEEGKFTEELFWNASYFDGGKIGLLTVDGNKVAYENIQL